MDLREQNDADFFKKRDEHNGTHRRQHTFGNLKSQSLGLTEDLLTPFIAASAKEDDTEMAS